MNLQQWFNMDSIADHTIEVYPAALRIKYAEPRGHVLLGLEILADDTWQVRPESLGWWTEARGGRTEPTPQERELILSRVLAALRDRRHLRILLPGMPVPDTARPRLPILKDDSPPDGEDTLTVDPELEELNRFLEDGPMPDAGRAARGESPADLLGKIETALTEMRPMADAGWEQANSIVRQLEWCRGALRSEVVETPPGPFSMGLIATREFDMYGSQPELARRINEIEQAMNARLRG